MRLIDADKLKHHISWWRREEKELIYTVVDLQPTVDAVPVVRCRDCKYWKISQYNTYGIHICQRFSGVRGEYDFCSRGERKDGADGV